MSQSSPDPGDDDKHHHLPNLVRIIVKFFLGLESLWALIEAMTGNFVLAVRLLVLFVLVFLLLLGSGWAFETSLDTLADKVQQLIQPPARKKMIGMGLASGTLILLALFLSSFVRGVRREFAIPEPLPLATVLPVPTYTATFVPAAATEMIPTPVIAEATVTPSPVATSILLPPATVEPVFEIIDPGENFWCLADKWFGPLDPKSTDVYLWRFICMSNQKEFQFTCNAEELSTLQIGMRLYIPRSSDFPRSNMRDPLTTPRVRGVDYICNPGEFGQKQPDTN